MKNKIIFIIGVILFSIVSFSTVKAETDITATLYQQETADLSRVRYVSKIEGAEPSDIKSFDVYISIYDEDGNLFKSNNQNYEKTYKSVKGLTNYELNVSYAVFTLGGLNNYKYQGMKLETYFIINLNDKSIVTNKKYYEIGTKYAIKANSYGGYNEGAYMEFEPLNSILDPRLYEVEYRSEKNNKFTKIDSELVRFNNGKIRADFLGLESGNYYLRAKTNYNQTVCVTEELEVKVNKTDRSGYAHFNYYQGVGAYNDFGKLKSDAVIIYVTEETKNTVALEINGKNCVGISEILKNQQYLNKPLDVRIIGNINTTSWNELKNFDLEKTDYSEEDILQINQLENSGITKLNGLSNNIFYNEINDDFDYEFNMLEIVNAKNLTIEGVGEDAKISNFGFKFVECNSVEVKNLTFEEYPTDAVSFDSITDNKNLATFDSFTSRNLFIHHNTFKRGLNKFDVTNSKNMMYGNYATKQNHVAFITYSYNHFDHTYRGNQTGIDADTNNASITMHHNFYDNVYEHTLNVKMANVHMYNNYHYQTEGKDVIDQSKAYVFIEYSYFEETKNTFTISNFGTMKTFKVERVNCVNDTQGVYESPERDSFASNSNIYNHYQFDRDERDFYFDEVNGVTSVSYITDAKTAKDDCIKYSGVLGITKYININHNDQIVLPSLPENSKKEVLVFPNTNDFFSVSGNNSTIKGSVTYDGVTYDTCLKMETKTEILFNSSNNKKLVLVFDQGNKKVLIDSIVYTTNNEGIIEVDLSEGNHVIKKVDSINLFYGEIK